LVVAAVALGLAEWLKLLDSPAGASGVMTWTLAAVKAAALIALVEQLHRPSDHGKSPRYLAMYVALIALLAMGILGQTEWLRVGLSVLIAIAGLLSIVGQIARLLRKSDSFKRQAFLFSAVAAFLVAEALDSTMGKLVALLLLTGGFWVHEYRRVRAASGRPVWQFVTAGAFGCLLLTEALIFAPSKSASDVIAVLPAEVQSAEIVIESAEGQPQWAQVCLLALAPPLFLLVLGWTLSRLRLVSAGTGA
jgi:hypothetical protein